MTSARDVFRVVPGRPWPSPRDTPLGPRSKSEAEPPGKRLGELQEVLYAEARQSVLLVLQGMDTSGKGGAVKQVCRVVNPLGLRVASFKKPTEEELRHDFLWRIGKQVPDPGQIGVFDRSHYEDVLIARVEELAPGDELERRYGAINAFEAELAERGVAVVKCFLHISPEEQKERLLARLDDPAKQWKYDPADLVARAKWSRYQEAYQVVMERCSTDAAPWYVVPADRKWYRNWVVTSLLVEVLEEMSPRPPAPDFDVAAQRSALVESDPLA